jgi:hypothetical protein
VSEAIKLFRNQFAIRQRVALFPGSELKCLVVLPKVAKSGRTNRVTFGALPSGDGLPGLPHSKVRLGLGKSSNSQFNISFAGFCSKTILASPFTPIFGLFCFV